MTRRSILAAVPLVVVLAVGAGRATPTGIHPLSQSFCSPLVYHGKGGPQLLVVSDLPLQGVRAAPADRMARAIQFTIAQHRYRAGRHTVAFQSCSDSNPQTGAGDIGRCIANAKAYAGDTSVVGVIGTWNSHCTGYELPILNKAAREPVPMISPSNTSVGLTHSGAGTAPDEPKRYYPTGKRNFARVIAPDDVQGIAGAVLARRLHAKRLFVLDDREEFGLNVAVAFTQTARRQGRNVVGRASWDPDAADFKALARRVAKTRPDAVYLGGFGCPTCDKLIRELRASLGAKGALIAPDGFMPLSDFARAVGPAAEGMFATAAGTTVARLGPGGREIATRFGPPRASSGGPPFAAQAADVLLEAIAKSNGTRASISSHMLRLHVRHGILGTFGFDHNGDTTAPSIMVFRVLHGRQTLFGVLIPPRRLLPR